MPAPFKGPVKFDRFPWQREILNINSGQVSIIKAAQMGFSIAGLLRALYMVAEPKTDVLYILPTAALASDFAKARLDSVVNLSPDLAGLFPRGGDSVGLKKTKYQSHIYLRGSISKSGLVSVPVASAIMDEFDRCQPGTLDLVQERLSGQLTKYLMALSTPTLPEFGIAKQAAMGTQEYFYFTCPSCGKRDHLRFPDSVNIVGEGFSDPRCSESSYKCTHCQATLPQESKDEWLKDALWVPHNASAHGHRSFYINQLYSSTITPGELVVAYFKSMLSDSGATEFQNQKLGLPYLIAGARITDAMIEAVTDFKRSIHDERPAYAGKCIVMGVDVGTYLDCYVTEMSYSEDPGNEPYIRSKSKCLQAIRIPGCDFSQLDNLMAEWQVAHCCVDFQPETVNAKAFCRRFKGFASLVQYRRGTQGNEIKKSTDEYGVPTLTVDRTSFMDMALRRLHRKTVSFPRDIGDIFKEHIKAPARTYHKDDEGAVKPVYVALADDHFAHAMTLAEAAHFEAFSKQTGRNIKPGE